MKKKRDPPLPLVTIALIVPNLRMVGLRAFALVLVVGLSVQTSLPVTEYICRYTGARMTVCCCKQADNGPVSLERSGCCDVNISSTVLDRNVNEGAGVVAPPTIIAIPHEQLWRRAVEFSPSTYGLPTTIGHERTDRGRPTYLVQRRLLI